MLKLSPSVKVAIPASLLLAMPLLAWIWPQKWWGSHFLAYVPLWLAFMIVGLALGLIVPQGGSFFTRLFARFKRKVPSGTLIEVVLPALAMGGLFLAFPMAADIYGDAFHYNRYLDTTIQVLEPSVIEQLQTFDLRPESGRNFLLALLTLASYTFGVSYGTVFHGFGLLFGVVFSGFWLSGIRAFLPADGRRWLMALAGLSAPFLLIFMGHIDTYGIVYAAILGWLLLLLRGLISGKKKWLWIALFLLPVCIKIHPLTVLLSPALLMCALYLFVGHTRIGKWMLSPKGIALWLLTPVFLAGLFLYFIVFQDYHDDRALVGIVDFDRLFLPIFSPKPPLDRYNLFSGNHFFDLFQVLWFWSPAALFLLGNLLTTFRKQINWYRAEVLILGTTLLLYVSFLFAINPLLALPMDWDLFSIPAVVLLVLLVALLRQLNDSISIKQLLPGTVAMVILSLPVFAVHSSKTSLSHHLEDTSEWVFRSYFERAGSYLDFALSLESDEALYWQRKTAVAERLKEKERTTVYSKYAGLLMQDGLMFATEKNDNRAALNRFEQAYYYDPELPRNLLQLVQTHFILENYEAAYQHAVELAEHEYPDKRRALRALIQCALETERYEQAQKQSEEFLKSFPKDQFIAKINRRLAAKDRVEELKLLFARN